MFRKKRISNPVKSVDDFIKNDLEGIKDESNGQTSTPVIAIDDAQGFDETLIQSIEKDISLENENHNTTPVLKKDDLLKIAEKSSKPFFTPIWVGKTIATLLAKALEKTPMANNKWQFPAISIDGKRTVHYLGYQDNTMVLQLIPQKISIDINDIKDEEELRIVDYFITNVL